MVGQMQEILSYEIPSYDGVGCASALFGATITLACTAPMRTLALPPDLNSLLNSVHSGHDLVYDETVSTSRRNLTSSSAQSLPIEFAETLVHVVAALPGQCTMNACMMINLSTTVAGARSRRPTV